MALHIKRSVYEIPASVLKRVTFLRLIKHLLLKEVLSVVMREDESNSCRAMNINIHRNGLKSVIIDQVLVIAFRLQ